MNIAPFLSGWLNGFGTQKAGTFVAADIVKITGGNGNAAILFSQILYWNAPSQKGQCKIATFKHGKYWLAKRYEDWEEETGINEYTARNGIKRLKTQGLIETKVMKWAGNPTVHIALCHEVLAEKLTELYPEPNDQLGSFQETTNQVGTKMPDRSVPLTETTDKKYTHSKEQDSEQSSGVCETSPKAPLGESQEAMVKPSPTPKPSKATEDEGVATLLKNEAILKKLGIRISGALKAAAHGLTKDEVIDAGKALQEGVDGEWVQNKQAYLMSALRNRYAPSEEWLEKQEQDQRRKEAARLAQQREEEEYRQEVEQAASVKEQLAKMEADGEIIIYHERSRFIPGGEYWFEYPGVKNIRRCDARTMPPSREWLLELADQAQELGMGFE